MPSSLKNITFAASINGKSIYLDIIIPFKYSPLEAAYSLPAFFTNRSSIVSNSSSKLRSSSKPFIISLYLFFIFSIIGLYSKPAAACSYAEYSKSVTLSSSSFLLPGAEGTTKRLSLSARIISATFLNCSALARELPPNFATIFILFIKFYNKNYSFQNYL